MISDVLTPLYHHYILVGYVLYSLHVCEWACQIRQLRLTIPRSSDFGVVCIERFPTGVPGGAGMPPPGYTQHSAPGIIPGPRGFGVVPRNFFWGRILLFLAVF
jgi:hypothetical protein